MIVKHRTGEYPIHFVSSDEALADWPNDAYLITDDRVLPLYASRVPDVPLYAIPAGEESKTASNFLAAVDWLAEKGAKRGATVVALGGGVVGDLAGYVAASYMRGVRLLMIPTTLLAQVDSSVGGKVGVDLRQGKNLLGAFYPPSEVRIATGFLDTLPERQVKNGMAEVLKYGFIMRPFLLAPDLARDDVVKECIRCKKEVVEQDELETTGLRAILNFGHTVGHAIEKALGYRELLHGEAISIGMVVEAHLGERLGLSPAGTAREVRRRLDQEGLPVTHPVLSRPTDLLTAMSLDKKTGSDGLAFSLLRDVGECELVKAVPEADVLEAIRLGC